MDKIVQYTKGDCWHLAMKISELTGWPCVELDPDMYWDQHVLVQMPDGMLLDITGIQSPERYEDSLIEFDPDKIYDGNGLLLGCWRDNGYTFKETEFTVEQDALDLLKREGLEWAILIVSSKS
jgi:hypothetical protein